MGIIRIKKAIRFDDNGVFIDIVKIPKQEPYFGKKHKSYNVMDKEASFFKMKGLIIDKIYFLYNINNPNPYKVDKKCEPIMNSDAYNSMLETKVIRDMNKLEKSPISDLLTPRNIIIGLVVIGAIIYFATGGKIT